MASTFLDEKISSFIEDKFPEFVKNDHPVFVEFLREYYKFLEAAKITLTNVQQTDQILLENKLTTNYLSNEQDDTRFVYENSTYGAFQKDEIVTGQTSGATATVLAEDNANSILYIEANRHFQVGEIITGNTSDASATIGKYQGNPVQNIQQLLEYVDIDTTINDYLDQFREAYLTAVPNTLATGVSKRKLVKSVRDLYRAKGSRRAHEAFFRLMFNETPELTYPTENILKISAGDWSSDTVLRVVATENDPNNLVGQTISQTLNVGLSHGTASAAVESVLQFQEGETTVYQLILNVDSISGTFVDGAEISGIDNSDADVSITATVQPILISASVTEGAAGYTTNDTVTISSASGQNALISIVDVGSGEIGQIVIDNPGTNYTVGDPLFFDNTNTEGAGASAIVSCIGGAIAPEAGDTVDHTVTGNTTSGSTSITNINTSTLYEARQFELFANLSVGSTSITNITTNKLVIGATIEGTGIPTNTTIVSIDTAGAAENGTITVSNAITHGGITGSISSITRSGTTATVTTSSAHGLTSDDIVTITGATPTAYNGAKDITVTSTTQFTYAVSGSASTPAGGTKTFEFTGGNRTREILHLEEGTGQSITGSGIPTNTTIRKITTSGSGGAITISQAATATATGVTLTIPSEYGMNSFDHIVFDEGTEATDAYTGNQIQLEKGAFATSWKQDPTNPLSVSPYTANNGHNIPNEYSAEFGEVVNVTVFSPGSGYEVMPIIKPATNRLSYNQSALTSSGIFITGEKITNDAVPAITATITTFVRGKITIAESTGSFAIGQVITGSQSNAKATLTAVDPLGANATFLGWSTTGLGAISGVEVTNFGTGFSTAPAATVPVKMLLTRNINVGSPPDITLATAFAAGDTIIGQSSGARGVVTAWDNARQTLTVRTTLNSFQRSEILTRGSGTNYAILSEINKGALSTTIGTIGTTAGAFNNDKGKISESLMRIQDSYYYQDFSYVVKVGAAIADWRAEIKKAVHPAGFAMFGEVSITNKVEALMTVPVTGITSETPTLASLFEAVLTTVVGRRLGTDETGTAVPQSYPQQYAVNGNTTINTTSITNITTSNLAVGNLISGLSIPLGATITSIDSASSGAHNNGTISISKIATATSAGETFWVSVPYTTEYSITNTLLGETEMKGTSNYDRGTLKRGSHLGHEPQLFSTVETITRSGTTATVETTGPHGVTAGEQVEISGVTTTGYDGVYEVVSATDDTFTITVSGSLTTPATIGEGKVKLVSPFDNSTRDVTLRPLTEVTVYPLYGDWASAQRNRYGLGPRQSNAIKYMWATPPTEYAGSSSTDITANHQIILENDDGLVIQEPEVLDRVDFTVTAATGKFIIDGVDKPALNLDGARYYRFDLSSSTTSTHPFKLSETSESGEYNEVVTEGIEFDIELETGSYTDHTVTGNTTSGSNTITNITTTLLGVGNKISGDFYSGIPVGATIASIVTEGSSNNGSITISSNATQTKTGATLTISEYGLGQDETHNLIAEDGEKLLVQIYDRVTSYGTQGSAGAYVEIFTNNLNKTLYYYCGAHSGMGNSLTISEREGDFIINEAYQLGGESAVNNILLEDGGYILYETDTDPESQSVMVSEDSTITYGSITEDLPSRLDGQMAYAYPNITRRESPESGTDNVDAGSAGVYDTTMNYTNIKIWDHESNVHNRISDFADVRIVDIIKSGREILEAHDDLRIITTGNTSSGSSSLTNVTTTGLLVGQSVTGTGIPANTEIKAIPTAGASNNGTITLSSNASASGSGTTITFGSVVYNPDRDSDSEYEFTIMEDGSYIQMESGSAGIPLTSRKIWNVPPPSYIRLTTS